MHYVSHAVGIPGAEDELRVDNLAIEGQEVDGSREAKPVFRYVQAAEGAVALAGVADT